MELTVADNGAGMTPERLKQVRESLASEAADPVEHPFFRTDQRQQAHPALLQPTGRPYDRQRRQRQQRSRLSVPFGRKRQCTRCFLADDEIVVREGIRNNFPWDETEFALVGEAPDGEMALSMLQDIKPDILITDIRMPFYGRAGAMPGAERDHALDVYRDHQRVRTILPTRGKRSPSA